MVKSISFLKLKFIINKYQKFNFFDLHRLQTTFYSPKTFYFNTFSHFRSDLYSASSTNATTNGNTNASSSPLVPRRNDYEPIVRITTIQRQQRIYEQPSPTQNLGLNEDYYNKLNTIMSSSSAHHQNIHQININNQPQAAPNRPITLDLKQAFNENTSSDLAVPQPAADLAHMCGNTSYLVSQRIFPFFLIFNYSSYIIINSSSSSSSSTSSCYTIRINSIF